MYLKTGYNMILEKKKNNIMNIQVSKVYKKSKYM